MDEFKLTNERSGTLSDDPYYCKFHRFASRSSFIEVVVKKTDEKVISCIYCLRKKEYDKNQRSEEWKDEKERITPYYVRRILTYGKNRLKMHQIPDELVEVKTAVIQLNRLSEKMNAPLRKCGRHGDLYEEDIIKAGKEKSGNQKYRCKKCMSDLHRKNYELNKTKIALRAAKYRNNNRDRVNAIKRKSANRYNLDRLSRLEPDKMYLAAQRHKIEKSRKRDLNVQDVQELTDSYVKRKIVYRSGLKSCDVPPELVEAKRALMMLNRNLKRKRDETIYNYLKEKENGKK